MEKNDIVHAYELINEFVKEHYPTYEVYLKQIVNGIIEVSLKLKTSRMKRPTVFLSFEYKNDKIIQVSL